MEWILYVLLALAVAGDILLAVILAKVLQKNNETQQKIDTADDFVRAMTPVLQSETDLLAEQLRAMQGESARTTSATLRDFSAVLAENQRQSAATNTARLEAIDRAGAARQKAANDALLAQLTMMETRLKNLEDSNAVRMDSVRGAVVQGLNTIRADNNKSWTKFAVPSKKSCRTPCSSASTIRSRRSAPSWNRSTRAWARCRIWPPMWAA